MGEVDSDSGVIDQWSGRKVAPLGSQTTGGECGCSREYKNHPESRQPG